MSVMKFSFLIESRIFNEQFLRRRAAVDCLAGGEGMDVIDDVTRDCFKVVRGATQREQLVEPLFDDFQRGGFLAHKQDGLSVSQTFGNDVDNRLTLARSRRRGET